MRKTAKDTIKAVLPASATRIHSVADDNPRPATPGNERLWPFRPQDVSPLVWWRMLPSDLMRDAEHLLVCATLDGITVMRGGHDITAALQGDPAAAIAVALSLMPVDEVTLEVDIAMTAVLRCTLAGNAAAALVLAKVVGRAELDHPFATELSGSWYTHHLRHSPDRRKFTPDEKAVWSALRKCDERRARTGDLA
ncbi:hypothetical protein [Bradyrhizobium sp. Ash2021]|uniref:hypothetical protein n=1 Tax=Bradyrhizobium sp. Ash2021 TaxID=2954771 RepID=UPI002814BC30|nr:hypothetical protein [Bradyrhizobium sp. Ash2021]WMT73345.1 hypothetical protein NL528_36115 [Bradyrhizobium sp. Ash2021]